MSSEVIRYGSVHCSLLRIANAACRLVRHVIDNLSVSSWVPSSPEGEQDDDLTKPPPPQTQTRDSHQIPDLRSQKTEEDSSLRFSHT